MYKIISVAAAFALAYGAQTLAEGDCAANIELLEKNIEASQDIQNSSDLMEKFAKAKALCQAGQNEEADKLLTEVSEHELMKEAMKAGADH